MRNKTLFIFCIICFPLLSGAAGFNNQPIVTRMSDLENHHAKRKNSNLNYQYFADVVTSSSAVSDGEKYYEYVDPMVKMPKDTTVNFFKKIEALNHLEKTVSQIKALEKLNRFLATNYKTAYLPGNVYYEENNHLPKPLKVGQLADYSFNAVAKGKIDELSSIIDNFNVLHIKDANGYSLFAYSILHKRNDIARMLMYKGAYINDTNKIGSTPLIVAAKSNNSYMVKILINNGVNPLVEDKFGKIAYDYAMVNDNHGLASLLKRYAERYEREHRSLKKYKKHGV